MISENVIFINRKQKKITKTNQQTIISVFILTGNPEWKLQHPIKTTCKVKNNLRTIVWNIEILIQGKC